MLETLLVFYHLFPILGRSHLGYALELSEKRRTGREACLGPEFIYSGGRTVLQQINEIVDAVF